MYRGREERFSDFSGGLVLNRPITELAISESPDLDNIVVLGKGQGFRSRYGDTEFNSSAMVNGSTAVTGLHYFKTDAGTEYLIAVAGTKIFKSDSLDGTMDDVTGAVTVTAGADNHWSTVTFNNKVVGFGGPASAPDAPWVWTGTGNAAALGGTPPSAYGAFQANNRVFAFRTAANPSRIFWSILGNEADWTGVGSGYSDVWTSDNDGLTAAAVLNTNTVLLFKENSIHQMQIGSLVNSAFPIFPFAKNIGCAGKDACVVWDGICYFINTEGHMNITDGSKIYDVGEIPSLPQIDPLWNSCNAARRKYIQGTPYHGDDFEVIVWTVSYGANQSTNNQAFAWDLRNKCWLRWTTGFKSNCLSRTPSGVLYGGHYNGKVYKKDVSTAYTDASESSAVVNAYWTSGWIHSGKFETVKQPRKMSLAFTKYTTAALLRIFYGFDFQGLLKQQTVSQTNTSGGVWNTSLWDQSVWSGTAFDMKSFRLFGRGNFFQYKIQAPTAAAPMKIHGFSLSGKEYGQKDITH